MVKEQTQNPHPASEPNDSLPPPNQQPANYTLYTVQHRYYIKSMVPGSAEREISKQEYNELLEQKNNSHQRIQKK